jgi:hypothetical protein
MIMGMPTARQISSVDTLERMVTYATGETDSFDVLKRSDLMALAGRLGVNPSVKQSNVELLSAINGRANGGANGANKPAKIATKTAERPDVLATNKPETNKPVGQLETLIRDIASGAVGVDESAVQSLIDRALEPIRSALDEVIRPVEVHIAERNHVGNLPTLHHQVVPTVIQAVECGLHVMLVGPAGSGKSTVGYNVAEALDLECRAVSVGPADNRSLFFGYMDAQGRYVSTVVREMFENGGVLIIDEIDNGNPAVISVLNMMLAGEACHFPDGMVTKHDQFICIATANTWGNGSDRQYVGRQSLDAATLNRLTVQIEVNYDEKMERTLAISESPDHGIKWLEAIAQWRERAQNARLPIIISPRQTIAGSRLLQAGMGFNEVRDITVFAGLNQEAITTLTTVRS